MGTAAGFVPSYIVRSNRVLGNIVCRSTSYVRDVIYLDVAFGIAALTIVGATSRRGRAILGVLCRRNS